MWDISSTGKMFPGDTFSMRGGSIDLLGKHRWYLPVKQPKCPTLNMLNCWMVSGGLLWLWSSYGYSMLKEILFVTHGSRGDSAPTKGLFLWICMSAGNNTSGFFKAEVPAFPHFFFALYFTSAYEFLQMVLLAALFYLFSSSSIVLLENCVVSLF